MKKDLDAWLAHQPIEARPVGTIGKLNRWRQRNPVVANLAIGFFLMLSLMVVVSSTYALRARSQAKRLTEQNLELSASQSQATLNEAALTEMLSRLDQGVINAGEVDQAIILDAAIVSANRSQEKDYMELTVRLILAAERAKVFKDPIQRKRLIEEPALVEVRKNSRIAELILSFPDG